MRNIAVYGAPFDPFHIGHAFAIQYLLLTKQADLVILMPTFQHVDKSKKLTDFDHRFEMCRLGIQSYTPKVLVSMLEKELGGISKTIRTMRALRARQPGLSWRFVCSFDSIENKTLWGDSWNKLLSEGFNPLVVNRSGSTMLENQMIPNISSTEIRKLLFEGRDVSGFIPHETLKYIKEHNIYTPKNNEQMKIGGINSKIINEISRRESPQRKTNNQHG